MLSSHPGWTPRACLICGAIPMARGKQMGEEMGKDVGVWGGTSDHKRKHQKIVSFLMEEIRYCWYADIYTSFLKTKNVNWNPAKKCGAVFSELYRPINFNQLMCHLATEGREMASEWQGCFVGSVPRSLGTPLSWLTAGNSVQLFSTAKKYVPQENTVETHRNTFR